MHPSQTRRLPTALFLSLLSCQSSGILVREGIVVWFFRRGFFAVLGVFLVVVPPPLSRSILGLYSFQCKSL